MLQAISSINWLAVLLASIASFVLGGAWFMGLFPKAYVIALGREALPAQKPGPIFIVGPFVCGVLTTITTAILLGAFGITSMPEALVFGAVIALGYFTPHTANIAINPNFPRPFLYTLINAPYFTLSTLLTCTILTAMH